MTHVCDRYLGIRRVAVREVLSLSVGVYQCGYAYLVQPRSNTGSAVKPLK
jgi:hypothetical protein